MIPAHERIGTLPLVEQARVLGTNTGRLQRGGYNPGNPCFALSVILSNAKCAAEHVEIRSAFECARSRAANPPSLSTGAC